MIVVFVLLYTPLDITVRNLQMFEWCYIKYPNVEGFYRDNHKCVGADNIFVVDILFISIVAWCYMPTWFKHCISSVCYLLSAQKAPCEHNNK